MNPYDKRYVCHLFDINCENGNPWDIEIERTFIRYGFYRSRPNVETETMGTEIEPPKKNSNTNWRDYFRDVIPDEIRRRLPEIPDHVEEARHDCTYQFIESRIIPRMRDEKPLTALELQRMALAHKAAFQTDHPADYDGKFELIPDTDTELIMLSLNLHDTLEQDYSGPLEELTRLVDRAVDEFELLFDQPGAEELLYV